ncbi:MAG: thioredoxin domain-containing protein, partial [Conexibacter sp.]
TRRRLWQLGGALGLAAAIVVVLVLAFGGGGDDKKTLKAGETIPGQIESNARFAGIPQDGVTLGDPDAPVTLVEFADLQWPFCRDYTTNVMPTLVADYVKTGKLKMVFRNVAFIGTDSTRAAQMAAAAGLQNKLWEYIDIFYSNQGAENSGYVTDAFLTKVGHGVDGLDVDKAMNDRGVADVQDQLNKAQTDWQANGFTGTPSFLLGPTGGTLRPLKIQSLDASAFTAPIDKALSKS